MAFSNGSDDDEILSEINMTPLVDVMLVLLIIFMLTVPALTHSVALELPKAAASAHVAKPETITISVTREGIVHWNEDVVDETTLSQRLQQLAQQNDQAQLQVRGDGDAAYKHVISVMAAAQRAGVQKLGFITQP